MRPLSDTKPKPMLPVADAPIAAHVADAAVAAGAERLVFVVGYGREIVEEFFGHVHRGVPIEYAVQEDQVGTADAVAAAVDRVDGPFAVLNGDNVYDEQDLSVLFENAPAVGYTRVEEPEAYGVLSLDGERVTDVVEKPDDPDTNTVNTGAYAFPATVREHLDVPASERGEHELTDVLRRLLDDRTVTGVRFDRWADIAYPWDLLEANERALTRVGRQIDGDAQVDGDVHRDATLRGTVVVEREASIDAGVVVDGPVLVRRGATVGPNAYLRGPTVVGEGASVGHAVEVKNSLLMAGANVNHLSYVGDSVLGHDANLGAGTVVANLRHDGESVRAGDENRPTGRRKFGAVVGPEAKTGVNTSLNPGAVLSSGSHTLPGDVVPANR
jgi:bifunctional UDP-N-acetylglucosamine pyrophosphorylase/glucosamine-1-phosphate N-acetyltransferase